MEAQRKLDDWIKAGERTVTGPHLFNHDAAVARSKDMHHPPGEDALGEPIRSALNLGELAFDNINQLPRFLQIIIGRRQSVHKLKMTGLNGLRQWASTGWKSETRRPKPERRPKFEIRK